jgi:DNA helicase-2/ATP-dependent DNA helicase PcrA
MTLHTAKGLEFPVVFVTGWEDGQFPHMRALGDPAELSEERRLAYVGITRARQRLYLTRAVIRSGWGQPVANPESRFLQEIPGELIDWRRLDPGASLGGRGRRRPQANDDVDYDWTQPDTVRPGVGGRGFGARPAPAARRARAPITLKVGDRVTHDKYGLGTVLSTDGVGQFTSAIIDFGMAGKLRLMPDHAPIQKL